MPKYKVLFHASGLSVPADSYNNKGIVGFYTTRYVNAKNERTAKESALSRLSMESEVKRLVEITRNNTEVAPIIQVEEIMRVPFYAGMLSNISGFTFYASE